jgi:hypothetical protein
MTLGDIIDGLDERQNINDFTDFEVLMADGLKVTGIHVNTKTEEIYLSDTEEGITFE